MRPRLLGNGRVRLEIQPFDAQPEGLAVRYSGASTTLTVDPGATVAIGGITGVRDSSRSGASSTAQVRVTEETVLLVRVEVEAGERAR